MYGYPAIRYKQSTHNRRRRARVGTNDIRMKAEDLLEKARRGGNKQSAKCAKRCEVLYLFQIPLSVIDLDESSLVNYPNMLRIFHSPLV